MKFIYLWIFLIFLNLLDLYFKYFSDIPKIYNKISPIKIIFLLFFSIILLIYLFYNSKKKELLIFLTLIISSISNIFDLIFNNLVIIDYINFYFFYNNLCDIAITITLFLLIINFKKFFN